MESIQSLILQKCFLWKLYIKAREKRRDLTRSYDKSPYTHRQIKKNQHDNIKTQNKNFDYTKIADRFRTVSLSKSSHSTGVGWVLLHTYFCLSPTNDAVSESETSITWLIADHDSAIYPEIQVCIQNM